MQVITIPCRKDNFTYLVGETGSSHVAVIDPCDTQPVLDALNEHELELVAILNTHHHGDHVGGNVGLLERHGPLPVYAHSSDRGRIPGQSHFLEEGDQVEAAGVTYSVLFVPGHTRGHIAYVTDGAAFVGDTLFAAGCGRLFEGTAAQMNESLNEKIARLPDTTKLYFAHEYTASNLRFAASVEPDNEAIQERIRDVSELRRLGQWTTPSELSLEKRTNPFLRVTEPAVIQRFAAELSGDTRPSSVFAAVRGAKDRF